MKLRYFIYSLIFVVGLSTVASCKKQTCPTYATSAPTKRAKKTKDKQKSAPWHKSNGKMKKGKQGATPL